MLHMKDTAVIHRRDVGSYQLEGKKYAVRDSY